MIQFSNKKFLIFFEFSKQDIMFLFNNKKFQFKILRCFFSLLKIKMLKISKRISILYQNQIAKKFKIALQLEENIDLFKEIFHS